MSRLFPTWACIAWAPYSRRSEVFAKALGGTLHCVHYLKFQTPIYAPVKYVLQAGRTLQLLFRERPQAVHVQNPPFFCGLVVDLYCRLSGARFVFDHHSAAFSRAWRWARLLQAHLARRAVTNIVTNEHWANVVRAWGGHTLVMGDPFLPLPESVDYPLRPGFTLAFISTFAPDEPLNEVVEAARALPDVTIYVTGNPKHQPQGFFDNLPDNVICTGFLPDTQYVGLLEAVDVVLALTTRDHTLQLGGCEAVSAAKPLITSNWPFLKDFFTQGTLYVDNTAESIRDRIQQMQHKHVALQKEMAHFRASAQQTWRMQLETLSKHMEKALK